MNLKSELTELLEPNITRKFRHVSGFTDSTDYLGLHKNGEIWLFFKDDQKPTNFTGVIRLDDLEKFVRDGDWVEF